MQIEFQKSSYLFDIFLFTTVTFNGCSCDLFVVDQDKVVHNYEVEEDLSLVL